MKFDRDYSSFLCGHRSIQKQKYTQKEKLQSNATSLGRSMVEMLGVLAIIGVLSVGAIAGYSKAMMKYKLNKQSEQISTLLSAGLRYADSWNFSQSEATNLIPYLIKLGEVPSEMIKDSSPTIYDVFNTKLQMTYSKTSTSNPVIQFFIRLDTSRNDEFDLSICRNIVNIAKEFHGQLLSMQLVSGGESSGNYDILSYYGDSYCTADKKCLKDITVQESDSFCRYNMNKSELPHLKLMWYAN